MAKRALIILTIILGVFIFSSTPARSESGMYMKKIAAGGGHTVVIRSDGTLWAWGSNDSGQLGDGTAPETKTTPVQIGNETNWNAVAAGMRHTVALKTDGTLWAWGDNNFGQLGDGTTVAKKTPVQIGNGTNWNAVAARENHTIAQ